MINHIPLPSHLLHTHNEMHKKSMFYCPRIKITDKITNALIDEAIGRFFAGVAVVVVIVVRSQLRRIISKGRSFVRFVCWLHAAAP